MDWKAEMNSQFDEIRESLRPNQASADSAEPCVLGDSREISSCKFGRYTMGLEVGGEASAAQSGPFHSEIPKSQSTVVNETPKLQSVVANSRRELFGIPTNVNSSLGVIFESQEWGGSIAEDSDCESREVNLTSSNVWIDVFGSCTEEPNLESGDKSSFPRSDLLKPMKTMVQAESRVEVARGIEFTSSPSKDLALASSAIEEDTIGINPCHPLVSKLDDNPQIMKVNSVSLELPNDYVAFEEIDGLIVDSVDYIEGIPVAFVQSNSLIEIMDSSACLEFASAHKVLVKMSRRDIVVIESYVQLKKHEPQTLLVPDVTNCVELLGILGISLESIDSPSTFVFDPGTTNEFSFPFGRVAAKPAMEVCKDLVLLPYLGNNYTAAFFCV